MNSNNPLKKAVILLSGGLDSATVAAIAKKQNYDIYALSFAYGQRHEIELSYAKKLADFFTVKEHKIANIDLRIFGHSALTDSKISIPKNHKIENIGVGIPTTYVPARNTIFLSYALAYAETIEAFDIFIGVNILDYSGYPDCRPEFIKSFEKMANFATATNQQFKIHTPLIELNKSQIIQIGLDLGVDYKMTHSCYDPIIQNDQIHVCHKCDSCILRKKGFDDLAKNHPRDIG